MASAAKLSGSRPGLPSTGALLARRGRPARASTRLANSRSGDPSQGETDLARATELQAHLAKVRQALTELA